MSEVLHNGEHYRRLSEQARRLPGSPSASTPWRWANNGVRGIRLETVKIGGMIYASDEAIDRFLAAINEPSEKPSVKTPRSKREKSDSKKRAAAILQRAGI